MYIRPTHRKYKDKVYENHLLVESVHTPKGPRQRTVCSLGNLGPKPREEWLKLVHRVEEALVGQGDLFEAPDAETKAIVEKVLDGHAKRCAAPAKAHGAVVRVQSDEVRTEEHREAGPVHVGFQFFQRLELERILRQCGISGHVAQWVCVQVLNRLIAPKAELAIPPWARNTALGDRMGMDLGALSEDALYRAMDAVYPKRLAIEKALMEREADLFKLDRTVFFYDLTSTYFEGLAHANSKAKRGYSRDKRPDCKQVVLGLAVNRDGFPLFHESFEGNTQDRATLEKMLTRMEERLGLQEGQTVVVDRGMAYAENLAFLREHPKKLHCVVALRQRERDRYLADFEDLTGFEEVIRQPSPTNPFQKKSRIQVKLKREAGASKVLCLSEERVAKDRGIREKQEGRLQQDLAKLKQRVEAGHLKEPLKIGEALGRLKERYPRVARYYRIEYDAGTNTLHSGFDAALHQKAEELDGSYLLHSDRSDLSAEEAWRLYLLLTRAEDAFRDMKSPLQLRPIHHQLERRVDTHIFLCILAYHLLVAIEKTLLDQGIHTSWRTVRDALSTHQVCTVVLPTDSGATLRIRKGSTPEPIHRQIYALLGIPEQVMVPRKTWTEPAKGKKHSDAKISTDPGKQGQPQT